MYLKRYILCSLLPLTLSQASETVLGVYIFSRHGDRTSKSTPPANLTALGYQEIFTSGTYFRDRYIASDATSSIKGLSSDLVKLSQVSASAPWDSVLFTSAQAFFQGLYPPVGGTSAKETLRNGTNVQPPLSGYQLVPIQTVTSGTGSEDSAWLQGTGNCANALTSSNAYFDSADYRRVSEGSQSLYDSIAPLVNATFSTDEISYKNAYTGMFWLLPLTRRELIFIFQSGIF